MPNRGTIIAFAAFAAGVAGTVLDPDGPIGITLFGVAIAAALYLLARPLRAFKRQLITATRRSPRQFRVTSAVRGRTTAAIVAAMGALFALWLLADLSRPVTYVAWWGFCLLGAWLVVITLLTAHRSHRAVQ